MNPMKKAIMAAAMVVLSGVAASAATYVWIEGESSVDTNLKQNPWLKGDNPKLLSGGDLFGALNDNGTPLPSPGTIVWKCDVPEAGEYQVYFRHGWKGHLGQMKYRFVKLGANGNPAKEPGADEGWADFDHDATVMDQKPIGQYRTIEWTKQPPVQLEKGPYRLDLQITGPGPDHVTDGLIWTVIDVICLSKEPFSPSGYAKPGE